MVWIFHEENKVKNFSDVGHFVLGCRGGFCFSLLPFVFILLYYF